MGPSSGHPQMKGPPWVGNALRIPAPSHVWGRDHPRSGTPGGSRRRWLWERILREISVGIRDSLAKVLEDLCGALPGLADGALPGSPTSTTAEPAPVAMSSTRSAVPATTSTTAGPTGSVSCPTIAGLLSIVVRTRSMIRATLSRRALSSTFRLDALDRQLHTAERGVDAHVQIQEVEDIRLQRHPRR